jgi:PTH1 family peptidyl-tRNA hydrolase
MKVLCGLGNPGREYASTRHNVGWWFLGHLAEEWGFGPFRRDGQALVAGGEVRGIEVRLMEPITYMNRSGSALLQLGALPGFDPGRDLLVVVDDVALEPGRIRLRAQGSAGGHNGLKSIEAVLGTRNYARLRIGVGAPPPGADLADWVLSPMPDQERVLVLDRFPLLVDGVRVWLEEGTEAAMSRLNC